MRVKCIKKFEGVNIDTNEKILEDVPKLGRIYTVINENDFGYLLNGFPIYNRHMKTKFAQISTDDFQYESEEDIVANIMQTTEQK